MKQLVTGTEKEWRLHMADFRRMGECSDVRETESSRLPLKAALSSFYLLPAG